MSDTFIYNQWAGTLFLIRCAQNWERLAVDQSLTKGMRLLAAERAVAIRQELRPC